MSVYQSQSTTFQQENISTLWYFLHQVPDTRDPRGFRHPLPIVLTLAVLALCCGRKGYTDIAAWAVDYQEEIQAELPFLAGHTPDASTIYRIFADLDTNAFEAVFSSWVAVYAPSVAGDAIAIDGKTTAADTLHLVSAFVHRVKSVLFQQVTSIKGKEIPIALSVLDQIPVVNRMITTDALHAQRKICAEITRRGGGYVISVKNNQQELETSIALFFQTPPFGSTIDQVTTYEKAHGRIEKRTVEASSDLTAYLSWPGLTHVFRVTRKRTLKGITSTEVVYGIARLLPGRSGASDVATYLRGHWGIENRLHRQRDTVFGEDASTIRKNKAAHTMSILRNIVTTFFYQTVQKSFTTAMHHFAAKPKELFTVLDLSNCRHLY